MSETEQATGAAEEESKVPEAQAEQNEDKDQEAKAESANGETKEELKAASVIDHTIRVYISSVSLDRNLKINQQKMLAVLDAKKIPYETIDIAHNKTRLHKMRLLIDDQKALPPQIFHGSQYLGNIDAFVEATDDKELNKFLKL